MTKDFINKKEFVAQKTIKKLKRINVEYKEQLERIYNMSFIDRLMFLFTKSLFD